MCFGQKFFSLNIFALVIKIVCHSCAQLHFADCLYLRKLLPLSWYIFLLKAFHNISYSCSILIVSMKHSYLSSAHYLLLILTVLSALLVFCFSLFLSECFLTFTSQNTSNTDSDTRCTNSFMIWDCEGMGMAAFKGYLSCRLLRADSVVVVLFKRDNSQTKRTSANDVYCSNSPGYLTFSWWRQTRELLNVTFMGFVEVFFFSY